LLSSLVSIGVNEIYARMSFLNSMKRKSWRNCTKCSDKSGIKNTEIVALHGAQAVNFKKDKTIMEVLLGVSQFLLIVITLYSAQSYFKNRNKFWLHRTIFYFLCFFISFTYSSWWPIVIALLAAVYYIVGRKK
jgi:hypothetical protein